MELVEGHRWREEREWERAAWTTAHLLSCLSGKRIHPKDLLTPVSSDPRAVEALLGKEQTYQEWVQEVYAKQAARAARRADN